MKRGEFRASINGRDLVLPGKYEVCPRCKGEGKHTNPNIDGNGITEDEWAEWGDEEKEMYLNGGYDVTCETCKGDRVVAVLDESAFQDKPVLRLGLWRTGKSRSRLLKRISDSLEQEAEYEQMARNEAMWEHRMLYGRDD